MSTKRVALVVLLACTITLATGIASGVRATADPAERGAGPDGPASTTSLLGPEFRICCGNEHDQSSPAVAYNRNRREYLVVSSQALSAAGAITGARVELSGWRVGGFLLSAIGDYDCCGYPAVAYNGWNDEYLVVWQQYNTAQSKWEIYGRIFPWDGPDVTDTPFLIAQWSSMNLKYPRVAYNSYRNEYMVVWHTEDMANNLLGIGRRWLGADGGSLGNADYITQSGTPSIPDIAYNVATDQYLVVWAQVGTQHVDIYGGRLSRSGALQGTTFAINAAENFQLYPTVATNEQNRYLVVWQDKRWGDWDIYGQFLDASANSVGESFWLDISNSEETHPEVTANGASRKYMVVYQKTTDGGESIWANQIDESGAFLNWFEVSAGGLGDNGNPAVGTHLSGYLVAYEWESWSPGTSRDIYGRMWSSQAVFLPLVVRNFQ